MSDDSQTPVPPGFERLDKAPEFDADVDPRLLKQIEDPADRYQVEAMSVMRQDVRWLKHHMVIAYNMALDSYGTRQRMDRMEKVQQEHALRFDNYRFAPLKLVYWVVGIAVHTGLTVLLTVWLTKGFGGGAAP